MFTVDGVQWSIPCDIKRVSEVRPSDISGMLLNKAFFNDVLGTYMQYEITLIPDPRNMADYYALYELLNSPVDGHTFVLPYNGNTVTLAARVSQVSDVYVRMPGGAVYWKGVSFTITANGPTKTESLGSVIARGLSPLPEVDNPQVGDTYTWDGSEWDEVIDADDIAY